MPIEKTLPCSIALFLISGACRSLTPPVILAAGTDPLGEVFARHPPGTELVEVETSAGDRLRGLFVPAEPGAPVVLHLLDSGASCASPMVDLGELSRQLVDLGWSSLVLDYSGVGLSTGERSVRNLRADALAAWGEAVRRAGNDPGRVIVRAISIGTLAAALLCEAGARPAAMVWIVPVFADTVAARFARATMSPLMGWVARGLFRPAAEIVLDESLARFPAPALVITSAEDELTSPAERDRLASALRAPEHEMYVLTGRHILVAARARWLFSEELYLFRSLFRPDPAPRLARVLAELPIEIAARFPEHSEARARLAALSACQRETPAAWIAAAALAIDDAESAARMLWCLRRRPYPELAFDDLAAALSLADPSGELPLAAIEACSLYGELAVRFEQLHLWFGPETVVSSAWNHGAFPSLSFRIRLGGGLRADVRAEPEGMWDALRSRCASDADAVRRYVRVVLKGERAPDRLVPDGSGGSRLEYFDAEARSWEPLDLSPEANQTLGLFVLH